MEALRRVWRMPLFAPRYMLCAWAWCHVFFFTGSQTGNMRAACCYGNRSLANQQCSQTCRAQIRDLQKLHKLWPNSKSSTIFVSKPGWYSSNFKYNILIFFPAIWRKMSWYLRICCKLPSKRGLKHQVKKVIINFPKTIIIIIICTHLKIIIAIFIYFYKNNSMNIFERILNKFELIHKTSSYLYCKS